LRNLVTFKKNRQIYKTLALSRKTDGFINYWRFSEKQADLQNIGALQKNRRTIESWRALKSPSLGEKPAGLENTGGPLTV
jgi:hypothetical protein